MLVWAEVGQSGEGYVEMYWIPIIIVVGKGRCLKSTKLQQEIFFELSQVANEVNKIWKCVSEST